jgi:hypothetical protein
MNDISYSFDAFCKASTIGIGTLRSDFLLIWSRRDYINGMAVLRKSIKFSSEQILRAVL